MLKHTVARRIVARAFLFAMMIIFSTVPVAKSAFAQASFDVAAIHPSGAEVKFERNGKTEVAYGTLRMRDVTVSTCIQWAYGTSQALVTGPASLTAVHYDITAKTDPNATKEQMQIMLRTLLSERFKLAFHVEKKEMRVYTLTVAKSGIKMHPSAAGGEMHHENSATGMVGRSVTMHELADYLSDPLNAPLTDGTGLPGRYDFAIDFTPYVDMERSDVRPDPVAVLKLALKGDLGLALIQSKEQVDVMVVDHVEPPSSN
ncbi:MAG TPA: TIGR03435 family protein [Acidobacteriaceae bacterium]